MSTEGLYYIQDARHYSGNSCFWWRIDGKGYTCNLKEAWRVTEAEARSIIKDPSRSDIAWPCSLIDEGAETHFDMQKLRGHNPLRVKKVAV